MTVVISSRGRTLSLLLFIQLNVTPDVVKLPHFRPSCRGWMIIRAEASQMHLSTGIIFVQWLRPNWVTVAWLNTILHTSWCVVPAKTSCVTYFSLIACEELCGYEKAVVDPFTYIDICQTTQNPFQNLLLHKYMFTFQTLPHQCSITVSFLFLSSCYSRPTASGYH